MNPPRAFLHVLFASTLLTALAYRPCHADQCTNGIRTVAGKIVLGDGGLAKSAMLTYPGGVAADSSGNIYFADGSRIRKVDGSGTISTAAGTGINGDSGDGGPATSATLNLPGELRWTAPGICF